MLQKGLFNMSFYFKRLSVILGVLLSAIALDSQASDFQSGRTAALGRAGHAGPMLTDSIFINPDFISIVGTQSFSAAYSGYSSTDPNAAFGQATGRAYTLAVMDGQSELFQAGLAHTVRADANYVHV